MDTRSAKLGEKKTKAKSTFNKLSSHASAKSIEAERHEFILELPGTFYTDITPEVVRQSSKVKNTEAASDVELIFVNLDEHTGPSQDMETRNLVRSHVMKDFQSRKHRSRRIREDNIRNNVGRERHLLSHVRGDDLQYATESGDSGDAIGEDDEEIEEIVRSHRDERVSGSAGSMSLVRSLEPFDVVPMAMTPRLRLLMHYYNTVLLDTLVPLNPKEKWFSHAIADPALFRVTLLHASMHHSLMYGESTRQAEEFELKREAIEIVRRKIEDPKQNLNDFTIAAVANLVQFENQSGNIALARVHSSGLQKMVALRGGLGAMDACSGLLRRKILWGDLLLATLEGREPYFNITESVPACSSSETDSQGSRESSEEFSEPSTWFEPCSCAAQFLSVMDGLRFLSNKDSIQKDLKGCLSDRIYILERQLLYLFKSITEYPRLHSRHCTSTILSCVIAAQMYLYRSLRDFPCTVPVLSTFVKRLLASFDLKHFLRKWESTYEVLMWVLTLASMVAVGQDKLVFVGQLAFVCRIFGVESLDRLTSVLERVAWRDASKDLYLVSVWNDVHYTMLLQEDDQVQSTSIQATLVDEFDLLK